MIKSINFPKNIIIKSVRKRKYCARGRVPNPLKKKNGSPQKWVSKKKEGKFRTITRRFERKMKVFINKPVKSLKL